MNINDTRLIEHGFPCHQVGAETQRERGASSALPPLYYLHVWWARRPLTPSRAAILASLLPADTDPETFVRSLGIEKCVAQVNGHAWTLTGNLLNRIQKGNDGQEYLPVDQAVLRALDKEQLRRKQNRELIAELKHKDSSLQNNSVVLRWEEESQPLPEPWPEQGEVLNVQRVMGDPAWFKQLMALAQSKGVRVPNLYGYDRAFANTTTPDPNNNKITILDPTAGGGSVPFEAIRLGYNVIANELNPVASVILYATLKFPAQYGPHLVNDIEKWGKKLVNYLDNSIDLYFPRTGPLHMQEDQELKKSLPHDQNLIEQFNKEEVTTYLYCRQVTCPHCLGEAPLLNSCWLSKEDGKQWGVRIVPDGKSKRGTVRFETYRVNKGKGPKGEDPNMSTVSGAVGQCIHCSQAISGDEIKAQARGESRFGSWKDRLYCVVAIRHEPKLDKQGKPQRYASGEKSGLIKTQKIRFFRPPKDQDLQALQKAEERLQEKWDEWVAKDYIPTEKIPSGHKTSEPLRYGMPRWCDMFTSRQLLGHCTLVETLNELKPQIIAELGEEKGRAVITYLQFAIDKGVDYNSRQTLWNAPRGVIAHAFTRHDYSLK